MVKESVICPLNLVLPSTYSELEKKTQRVLVLDPELRRHYFKSYPSRFIPEAERRILGFPIYLHLATLYLIDQFVQVPYEQILTVEAGRHTYAAVMELFTRLSASKLSVRERGRITRVKNLFINAVASNKKGILTRD